jgi:hypothetical protein
MDMGHYDASANLFLSLQAFLYKSTYQTKAQNPNVVVVLLTIQMLCLFLYLTTSVV